MGWGAQYKAPYKTAKKTIFPCDETLPGVLLPSAVSAFGLCCIQRPNPEAMRLTCYRAKTCSCMMHTRQLQKQVINCVSIAQMYEREVTYRKSRKGLRLSQRLQHGAEF